MWKNPLAEDLDHILFHTQDLWEELRGRRLFMTGGTGFFGCWLLESLVWANDKLGLEASVLVLTRDRNAFQKKAPHLAAHPAISFHVGDVRSFDFPSGEFPFVIHAATSASATLNEEGPLEMFDNIVQGTRHTLDFAVQCGARKFLLTSSGAVYGRQPPEVTNASEGYPGAPDPTDPGSAYGEGKRAAELLCALYAKVYGIETKIARCFAFIGPYLPLDAHFAIGNFIRDGLRGGPIEVKGDGTPYRSYLYASDLAIWLFAVLFRGRPCTAYNVGSGEEIDIAQLAGLVAGCYGPDMPVVIAKEPVPGPAPERYVPSTNRAAAELRVQQRVDLRDAITKTIAFHRLKASQ